MVYFCYHGHSSNQKLSHVLLPSPTNCINNKNCAKTYLSIYWCREHLIFHKCKYFYYYCNSPPTSVIISFGAQAMTTNAKLCGFAEKCHFSFLWRLTLRSKSHAWAEQGNKRRFKSFPSFITLQKHENRIN